MKKSFIIKKYPADEKLWKVRHGPEFPSFRSYVSTIFFTLQFMMNVSRSRLV